jgi:hypothetical protein
MVKKSLLVSHVEKSIAQAEELTSKLKPEVLQVQGWSAPKFRHFLNNLCSKADTKYLEIGVWKGATHIAALYKNQIYSIAVDNFSEHWDETGYPVDSGEVDNSELEIFKQNGKDFTHATLIHNIKLYEITKNEEPKLEEIRGIILMFTFMTATTPLRIKRWH